jgi:iron(III) transport system substrate-binding protein
MIALQKVSGSRLRRLMSVLFGCVQVRAQGVLNICSARHYQTDEKLYENFTRQTGIRINRIEGKEEELMERIRNEGANSPADVFITVDAARLEIADGWAVPAV